MNAARPLEPMDVAAPVSLARQFLAERDRPGNVSDQRAGAVARLQAVAARHPNVRLVDPLPYFCAGGECPVRKAGVALFWDDDHVSASAARGFADWYRSQISG